MLGKKWLPGLFLAILVLFYIGFTSNLYTQGSINMARALENIDENTKTIQLFDPPKPFYFFLMAKSYLLLNSVFPDLKAMGFMRTLNLICGIFALVLIFVFLRIYASDIASAYLGAALFCFSYIFWFSSHEAEGLMLIVLLIILNLFVLVGYSAKNPGFLRLIPVGLMLGILLLLDISLILLILPFYFYIFAQRPSNILSGIVPLLIGILVFGLVMSIFYLDLGVDNLSDFRDLIEGKIGRDPMTGGSRTLFDITAASSLRTIQFTGSGFLAGSGTGTVLLMILAGLLFIGILVIFSVKKEHIVRDDKNLLIMSLLWLVSMLIFYAIWKPASANYAVYWMIPAVFIISITIFSGKWVTINNISKCVGGLLLAIVIINNLLFAYFPYSSAGYNKDVQLSEWLKDLPGDNSIIIYFSGDQEANREQFLKYFMPFYVKKRLLLISWNVSERVSIAQMRESFVRAKQKGLRPYLLIDRESTFGMSEKEFIRNFPGVGLKRFSSLEDRFMLYELISGI